MSPRLTSELSLVRDERRESWILVLPARRFIDLPRAETPARFRLDIDPPRNHDDLAPIEQCWIGALIMVWFGSLFWVLWHLLASN